MRSMEASNIVTQALWAAVLACLVGCGSASEDGGDAPFVAHAGPAQNVALGDEVTLDGGRSRGGAGTLDFFWELVERPPGSGASLDSQAAASPRFVADRIGRYRARLVVRDGVRESLASLTEVQARAGWSDEFPEARVSAAPTAAVGALVELDGTGSQDPEGRALSFSWALLERPSGSAALAEVESPAGSRARFRADVAGKYRVQLVVFDGNANSSPAEVSVTAGP